MLKEELIRSGISEDQIISLRYTSEELEGGMSGKEMYQGVKLVHMADFLLSQEY